MPGIEDWKIRPHGTIQKIFEENEGSSHEEIVNKIEEHFSQVLEADSLQVPSLNSVPLDQLPSGILVKYRCMIQDVFDPQFCFSQYKVTNSETQTSRTEFGLYRDLSNLGSNETVDFDSRENVTVERQGFYCVPIPGESDWVKQVYNKHSERVKLPVASGTSSRSKRGRGGDDDDPSDSDTLQKSFKDEAGKADNVEMKEGSAPSTQTEGEAHSVITTPQVLNMNLPLPNERGVPCILRVYSRNVELKTTDAIEVIGILSVDPQLACIFDEDSQIDTTERAELQAHEPPPSLVPRLHALVIKHLHHNNPELCPNPASEKYKLGFHSPEQLKAILGISTVCSQQCLQGYARLPFQTEDIYRADVAQLMEDAGSLHVELLSIIEHALLGDKLAAEYLLCNIVSNVYARADGLALGKLCINISGCPVVQRYPALLHHLISQLVPQRIVRYLTENQVVPEKYSSGTTWLSSLLIDMSIENMNTLRLIPSKDYNLNRLTAGMLQLAAGTHLVLNETALHQGQLSQTGVSNVKALADVISWQRVEYDYQWHPIPIHTDFPVVVLSDGVSLLPKDIHIPLVADTDIVDLSEHFCKLDSRLTEENLRKLRSYITACRLLDYSFSDELQKIIQEDFVEIRQINPKDMSIDDFHRMLGLVRALTCSYGQSSPGIEMWVKVKVMEETRKARIANLPRTQRS